MYEWMKKLILKFLKVPPEPDDPMGDVNSLLVFRASYNFFRYRFYVWLIMNVFGLLSALVVGGLAGYEYYPQIVKKFGASTAFWALFLIIAAFFLYSLFQTFGSYMSMRLDYELRWYKVSDRSLRIREGVGMVREMTMTFANIQNMEIMQGPIQRLFGIADLKVESAGGGSMVSPKGQPMQDNLGFHVAYFRGLDNAQEIRDIMRNRLEKIKTSGLGYEAVPESPEAEHLAAGGSHVDAVALAALVSIRDEAAKLHSAVAAL